MQEMALESRFYDGDRIGKRQGLSVPNSVLIVVFGILSMIACVLVYIGLSNQSHHFQLLVNALKQATLQGCNQTALL